MDHASRARALMKRRYFTPAIDHALLAMGEADDATEIRELRWLIGAALEAKGMALSALPSLEAVLAEDPDHARALASRGAAYDRLRKPSLARVDLERAVTLEPENAGAWEALANVCAALGDREGRDSAIEHLGQVGEVPAYILQQRGKERLDSGADGGEADLREAVRKGDPLSAFYLHAAGYSLDTGTEIAAWALDRQKRRLYTEAIESYQRAIEAGIDDAEDDVHYRGLLVGLLDQEGQRDQAFAAAEALTSAHPERADAWLARAALDGETSSFETAYNLSAVEAAVPWARHLLAGGRTERAREVCKLRLEKEGDDAAALTLLGEILMASGEPDQAKEAWLEAENLSELTARRLRVKAFGLEKGLDHFDAALDSLDQRQRDDAVAHFENAIDLFRQETRVHGDEAHRYLAKSLYNSAFLREQRVADEIIEPNLREATELDPTYTDPMLALGNLCLRTDRVEEGLGWFKKVGELDPSSGQAWYYRARHFASHGSPEAAIEDATKAFDAYAARGQTRFAGDAAMLRGECNEELGRLGDAKRDYDLAYDYGHPTGYAMGDRIRERIALEDPSSEEAGELLEKMVERIEMGECPWGQIDLLDSLTAESQRASALVAKLRADEILDEEETEWLVEFLYKT